MFDTGSLDKSNWPTPNTWKVVIWPKRTNYACSTSTTWCVNSQQQSESNAWSNTIIDIGLVPLTIQRVDTCLTFSGFSHRRHCAVALIDPTLDSSETPITLVLRKDRKFMPILKRLSQIIAEVRLSLVRLLGHHLHQPVRVAASSESFICLGNFGLTQ